jgi:hypothetical protein
MVLVTVVGEQQCRKGFEFVYTGPLSECRDCKVRNVCFHLEEGRQYRVTEIRDVHHECKVHEGGVRVVEVERIPTRAALKASSAIEGSIVSFQESDCRLIGCPSFRLCHPLGLSEGAHIRIASVESGEVSCPLGLRLKIVQLD